MSTTTPPAQPVYLNGASEPVLGFLHPAAEQSSSGLAVLICPPFGWDEVCSHRSRRDWAQRLAAAGHATLRLDLPGAGDSGGSPRDPRRLEAWTDATGGAAAWLRSSTGAARVVAVGIGLGGLIAVHAVALDASIDDLVLWAVPARGRALVRQLRAFAALETSEPLSAAARPEPSPTPDGSLVAGGFVLTAETIGALEKVDLTAHALPGGSARRVLLLERDGIEPDRRLRDHLEQAGVEVMVAAGNGYGTMMGHPQEARPPLEVFARVESWLAEATAPTVELSANGSAAEAGSGGLGAQDAGDSRVAELTVPEGTIRETPVTVPQRFGRLFGVLAEPVLAPSAELCAVFLNPGAIRHIGPNRMWVEAARRWAARGVPSLRLDVEGLGDADGDAVRYVDTAALYVPELVEQVRAALDALGTRELPRRFVLLGLCSGAYWSFQLALTDERVLAAFMLNPRALFWHPSLEVARDARKVGMLVRGAAWRKILSGEVAGSRMRALARWALVAPARLPRARAARRARHDELDRALDRLRDTDKRLLFLFSDREPLHEELVRDGRLERPDRWPNLELETVPGSDHTMRALTAQQHAHQLLDRALSRELERLAQGSSTLHR